MNEEYLEQAWAETDPSPRAQEPEQDEGRQAQEEIETGEETQTPREEAYPLKYMNQIYSVGREKMTTLAQKGMDYDRIRAERDELRALRDQGILDGRGEQVETLRKQARARDMEEFLELFPGVQPQSIPGDVWAQVRQGKSLVNAYSVYQARSAQAELAALRQNQRNQQRATGSLERNRPEHTGDMIARWWDEG